MRTSISTATGIVGGVAAALAALELVLRVFVTVQQPPAPAIARDALGGPRVESRQIDEGIGDAGFSVAGARLTGNAPIADARTIVLLGDSYVAAREVADSVTMGARLERVARAAGAPINVRQYGWRGASPAQYLLVAHDVLARWDPSRVVVMLSSDDLDDRAITGQYPRLLVRPDGSVRVLTAPAADTSAATLVRHSVLAMLVRHRAILLARRAPRAVRPLLPVDEDTPQPAEPRALAMLPDAVVRALRERYGARLAIVYVADVRVVGDEERDPAERALLAACAAQSVACASTRAAMLAARARGEIARGFATTTLGVGHLNATGHRLVAETIGTVIADDLRPASRLAGR